MRFLRIGTVLLFIVCLVVNILGNARYKARQDTNAPVIQSSSDHLQLSVTQGDEEALLQGLTAQDKEDGDLTGNILVASTSYFQEKGTVQVSYVVFDGGRNSGTYSRKVTYTDYESPRFQLTQPLVFYRGENIRYLNYVRATDSLEGDITSQIKVINADINQYTAGIYPVVLEVGNSYGDRVQVQLTVMVKEPTARGPEVFLKQYIVYLKQGESFDPYAMVQSVRAYGTGETIPSSEVMVLGVVDTELPGSYQLAYSCTQDGQEGRSYLTVVVEGD